MQDNNNKNKWRNYGLWVAIFAFIPLFLQGVGLDFLPANYEQIVNAFLSILVMAGIISNPTNGNWFNDKGEQKEG